MGSTFDLGCNIVISQPLILRMGSAEENIHIQGARVHNLKDIDLNIRCLSEKIHWHIEIIAKLAINI